MLTRETAIEIVENYVREIEDRGVRLREAILYGSFAKGTQHEWSDIDLALVADEFKGVPADLDFCSHISIKKPYILIEPRTYPTDYFRKGDPFIREIQKDGIVIYTSVALRDAE
jgi:predicted nucleotidyltransferase